MTEAVQSRRKAQWSRLGTSFSSKRTDLFHRVLTALTEHSGRQWQEDIVTRAGLRELITSSSRHNVTFIFFTFNTFILFLAYASFSLID